jgi:hypothetical protein
MQELRGEEVYLLLILDLGTRWGWVVSVTPRPRFTSGKRLPEPIGQEAGWASELVRTRRLEEKSFVSDGDRIPVVQIVVRVYWLSYPIYKYLTVKTEWQTLLIQNPSYGHDSEPLEIIIYPQNQTQWDPSWWVILPYYTWYYKYHF